MSRNFEQGVARGKGTIRMNYAIAKKKPLPQRSGFAQLFNSGLNQPTVYIHSFVKDSDNENGMSIMLKTVIPMKMTTYYCSLQYISLPLWNINRFTLKLKSVFCT